jgi:glycosyltransferase involved in cell wall biosynthesis
MDIWSKTCFMIDTLERHGAQKQLLLIARFLRENNRPSFNLIVFREPLTMLDDFIEAGVNVIFIKKRKEIDLGFFCNLLRTLRISKPAIVVTFLISPDIWGRLAAVVARVPVIGSSVREMPRDFGLFKDKMLYFLDRLSDFIVCNSKAAAIITSKRTKLGADKVSVIYNGIEYADSEELPGNNAMKPQEQTIGLVARLVPAKDISTLLRAFSRIYSSFAARLIVVGDGPLRPTLEEETAALGISEKVLFLGERSDAKEIMKQFDIGVLTSVYEGLSNAIMEYMHAGKPVVATNIGGNPELVEEDETGYLFEPGNDEQLAMKLSELLSSPEKGIRMGCNGRVKIVTSFSVKMMVKSWDAMLHKVAPKSAS